MSKGRTMGPSNLNPEREDAERAENEEKVESEQKPNNNGNAIKDENGVKNNSIIKSTSDKEFEQHSEIPDMQGNDVEKEQNGKIQGHGNGANLDNDDANKENCVVQESSERFAKEGTHHPQSDSDDFGSFSDASIEEDEAQDNLASIANYLEQILPLNDDLANESAHGASPELESLIQQERPRVIYEQLVLLRIVLKPFIWEKSCIKSNLWHILRIPEKASAKTQKAGREPLNDTLFTTLCTMLHDDTIRSTAVLRDQFGLMYTPSLTPVFLQEQDEKKREEDVPELLALSPDEVDDLQLYHDKLCQSIDLLLARLQELQIQQSDLMKDKTTFENVVTNLTGHTQRLYRDEVALYNKHKQKKKNRFSWVGH
ncbi:uncharacterized protein ZBIST_3937 [Zygosaccharomyces bailii]|nr:uncharacterized protein ZBIST_3937 [Zygosaccharomyces bailii]